MICSFCGKECRPVVRDEGIGPYEFWGQKCVDHNYQVYSDCCDALIENYDYMDYLDDYEAEKAEMMAAYREEFGD